MPEAEPAGAPASSADSAAAVVRRATRHWAIRALGWVAAGVGAGILLVALLVGLTTVQWLDRQEIVSELAEIDTALLVDDLPPAAYSDPGFVQFLRQSAAENDTPSAN